MKELIKERVEARKKAYKDLCQWIVDMVENELKFVLEIREYHYHEWLNHDEPALIDGAIVTLVVKGWFSNVEMDYLLMALGATSYKVTAYPLSRMYIDIKVPIMNKSKATMTFAGIWKPYWKRDEQEKRQA